MGDPVPTWAGVKLSVKRTGDKLPAWRDEEDNVVVQRLEGTGLAVRQRMGGTGWQVLEYVALSLTHDAVATLMPLRGIVPHDLIDFPIHGGVETFPNVYLEQLGQGEGPGFYPFEPDENVETPIRFLRLAPYSTGAPGVFPFSGGATGALNAPTDVAAASTGTNAITVTWTDTNGNESGYVMEFSDDGGATWQDGGSCSAGCTSLTMSGLASATAYTFRVRAYNALVFSAWSGTAGATTGGGGGAPAIAGFFAPSSPFNQDKSGLSTLAANNSGYLAQLTADMAAQSPGITVCGADGFAQLGVPIWPVAGNDPATQHAHFDDTTGWWDESGFQSVPMPAGAAPDPGSDGHMVWWDYDNNVLYEFWEAAQVSGTHWRAGKGITFAPNGQGWQSTATTFKDSANAAGTSMVAGLILKTEVVAGVIPHALAMAMQHTRGQYYAKGAAAGGPTCVATASGNQTDAAHNTANCVPEGMWLRLKASVNVAARTAGRSVGAYAMGIAAQTYGIYVRDTSGAPCWYAEQLAVKGDSWGGLLNSDDADMWTASDFEFLVHPALTHV